MNAKPITDHAEHTRLNDSLSVSGGNVDVIRRYCPLIGIENARQIQGV